MFLDMTVRPLCNQSLNEKGFAVKCTEIEQQAIFSVSPREFFLIKEMRMRTSQAFLPLSPPGMGARCASDENQPMFPLFRFTWDFCSNDIRSTPSRTFKTHVVSTKPREKPIANFWHASDTRWTLISVEDVGHFLGHVCCERKRHEWSNGCFDGNWLRSRALVPNDHGVWCQQSRARCPTYDRKDETHQGFQETTLTHR